MSRASIVVLAVTMLGGCFWEFGKDRYRFADDGGIADAQPRDASVDAGCTMMCGGECRNTTVDPMHCGTCDRSCGAPEFARAICVDSNCDFECEPGYARAVGSCVARLAPRPIFPPSTSTVTDRRPTLRWELAARSDGARVQLCEDRACQRVLQTVDAVGDRARPSTELPPGVVYWRLYSLLDGVPGTEASPTWQFYVGHRSAPVDTAWGTTLDLNGDGYADVAVGAPGEMPGLGRVYIYFGGPAGLEPTANPQPSVVLEAPVEARQRAGFGTHVAAIGDINGDGYGDLGVQTLQSTGASPRVFVYFGGAEQSPTGRVHDLAFDAPDRSSTSLSGGDFDGDGYSDVMVLGPGGSGENADFGSVFRGATGGFVRSNGEVAPAFILRWTPTAANVFSELSHATVGDVNGDGRTDIAVTYLGMRPGDSGEAVHLVLYFGRSAPNTTLSSTVVPSATLRGPPRSSAITKHRVAGAGDVTGDGLADVVVGVDWESEPGEAYLFQGAAEFLDRPPAAHIVAIPADSDERFGRVVSGGGDVDADGFADVVVASDRSVFWYRGGLGGLSPSDAPQPAYAGAVSCVRAIGGGSDLTADGYADLVVGCSVSGAGAQRGEVEIFVGGSSGPLPSSRPAPAFVLNPPSIDDRDFGSAVASGP